MTSVGPFSIVITASKDLVRAKSPCVASLCVLVMLALVVVAPSGCSVSGSVFPTINPASATYILAIGHFESVAELPPNPNCGKTSVKNGEKSILVCFDPPPLRFQFILGEVIDGELGEREISVYTTNHWGPDIFLIGSDHPYLLRLHTDGGDFVIPRNQFSALGRTRAGELAIPADGFYRGIHWLPCPVQSSLQPLHFAEADAVANFKDAEFDADLSGRYLERRDGRVRVTHGIELNGVRSDLKLADAASFNDQCGDD